MMKKKHNGIVDQTREKYLDWRIRRIETRGIDPDTDKVIALRRGTQQHKYHLSILPRLNAAMKVWEATQPATSGGQGRAGVKVD